MNLFAAPEESLPQSEASFAAVVGASLLVTVTRADSTTYDEYRHAWTEQSADPATGEYSDANPPRSGTTTLNYLTELSGRQVVAGTLVRAWLKSSVNGEGVYECLAPDFVSPTTFVGQTFNYYDSELNFFYGNTINFQNTTVFEIYENYSVVVVGPGYWIFEAPLVICGWQFWCYADYANGTGVLIDWALPSTRLTGEATVFRMIGNGPFSIGGIIPADLGTVSVENGPRAADAGDPIDGAVWSDEGNVFFDDELYATVGLLTGATSAWLGASNYGFNLPQGASVTGVAVTIRRGKDAGPGVIDLTTVNLHGGAHSTNKTNADDWPDADGDLVLGGSGDPWGQVWTAEDINGADFGVKLKAREDGTGAVDLRVDSILITVWYTLADAGQVIAILNLTGDTMTLLEEYLPELHAERRLRLEAGTDKVVEDRGIVLLWYDPTAARWVSFRQPDASALPASDEVVLGGNYTVTSAYASTGLTITLPAAGEYLVQAEVSGSMTVTGAAGGYISVRLYDQTAGAIVADSAKILLQCQVVSQAVHGSVVCGRRISVGGATVIRLEAQYTSTGAVSSAGITASDTVNGSTLIRYVEVAP